MAEGPLGIGLFAHFFLRMAPANNFALNHWANHCRYLKKCANRVYLVFLQAAPHILRVGSGQNFSLYSKNEFFKNRIFKTNNLKNCKHAGGPYLRHKASLHMLISQTFHARMSL
jgi:hypothetical protein